MSSPFPMHRWSAMLAVLLFLLFLLAACGPPPELAPYRMATLEPGKGLGDLRFDRLTLGEAVSRFGAGRVAVLVSDNYGFELVLAGGDLGLQFMTEDEDACDHAAGRTPVRELSTNLQTLLDAEPACRALPLSAITVSGDFWQGSTPQGVRLGSGLRAATSDAIHDIGLGTAMPRYEAAGPPGAIFYASRMPGEDDAPIEMIIATPVRD